MHKNVVFCFVGVGALALMAVTSIPPQGAGGGSPVSLGGAKPEKKASTDGGEDCDGGIVVRVEATNAPMCVRPGSGTSFRDCKDCPEMVALPAGEFAMGSPESEPGRYENEGPRHKVAIEEPFAVGRFSITVQEYLACMKEGACKPAEWQQPGGVYNISTGSDPLYKKLREALTGDRYPIVGVTWDDAKAYVKWLSDKTEKDYRLLTEAEFEYAARAGAATPFWWGETASTMQANYNGTYTYAGSEESEYRAKPVPVKTFQPNPWGLYQMHGNVWNWIEDCWTESYDGAPSDGSAQLAGDCTERGARGGSWNNGPRAVRAAIRSHFRVYGQNSYIGFRVGRSFAVPGLGSP